MATIYRDDDDKLHNDSGPAYVSEDGNRREWWIHGVRDRDEVDGPAVEDDNIQYYCYYINGIRTKSDDNPVVSLKNRKEWWKDGVQDRKNNPAVIDPDQNLEVWIEKGKMTKLDGPAFKNGDHEEYYIEGILTREDGPAVIDPDNDDIIYVLDGKRMKDEEEFDIKLKEKKDKEKKDKVKGEKF